MMPGHVKCGSKYDPLGLLVVLCGPLGSAAGVAAVGAFPGMTAQILGNLLAVALPCQSGDHSSSRLGCGVARGAIARRH